MNSLMKSGCILAATLLVSACAETQFVIHGAKELTGSSKSASVPKTRGLYKIGKPYRIKNTWYYPAEDYNYSETGIASWYGPKFHGRLTANGETFDMNTLTAAHRTLPMPSSVRVINLKNGRSLKLRVNDRGPFARGRIIDVSRRAAQLLGFQRSGTTPVRVEIIADESQRLKLLALNGKIPKDQKISSAVRSTPVESIPLTDLNSDRPAAAPANPPVSSTPPSKAETVSSLRTQPVSGKEQIFVQAGAYIGFPNASKARTRLSRFGAAWLSETRVGRQKYYRVRIGPLQSVDDADKVLSQIISAGFPKARIVVD
jgi:rare lipoprotein A